MQWLAHDLHTFRVAVFSGAAQVGFEGSFYGLITSRSVWRTGTFHIAFGLLSASIGSCMDTVVKAYLTLTHARGLGPRKTKLLVEHFGSAEAVLAAAQAELLSVPSVGPSLAQALVSAKESNWATEEGARAERLGVTLVPYEHEAYPESLRAIYDPPAVLYVRGRLDLLQARAVGIVGTRDASEYALKLTEKLAVGLAEAGVTVVSGLALGVDSAAHRGAVKVDGGTTVAVLGSGVDTIYPRQNSGLARTIWQGRGAVVSEYPLGTQPRPTNFPGRNRIINGACQGIVVVEAGVKSGALITANYAAEEGRTVFAVPGRVGDPRSEGTLALLKQGAVLVQETNDILQELGWDAPPSPQPEKKLNLSAEQQAVADLVAKLGTPLLDDLVAGTDLDVPQVLPLLTLLELQGVVKTLPGGRYTRVY